MHNFVENFHKIPYSLIPELKSDKIIQKMTNEGTQEHNASSLSHFTRLSMLQVCYTFFTILQSK